MPLLFSSNRTRVVSNDLIILTGHDIAGATRATVGGVPVNIEHSTRTSCVIRIPDPAIAGVVEVETPQGKATLSRPLELQAAPAPPPGAGQDDDARDFDVGAAVRSMGDMMPRTFRPLFQSAGNVASAIQTAHSKRPFAPGGDWVQHSVDTSAYAKWKEAKERAERYQQRAAADPANAHLQGRAQQAADIAAQRGRGALGAAGAGGAAGFGIGQGLGTSGVGGAAGGAIGTAFGPVGSVIGSVIGTVIEKVIGLVLGAVKKTFTNLKVGGDLGSQAVGSVLDGVKSAGRNAFEVGAKLADTVLGAIGARMGPGGASVAALASQATRSVGRILEMGFDGAAGIAKGVGRVAGMGVVGAGALVGGVAGGLALGPLGAIFGAAVGSTVGVVVMKVVAAVADMGGKLIGTFGKIFGEIGGLAAGLVKTVMDVMQEAKKALMEYANAAYNIVSHSGRSFGQSENLLNTRQAFGMSNGQTEGAYSSFGNMPLFSGAIKSAFGVKGAEGSDEEIESTVERAKKLPLMLRRVMLSNMPEGEDFWLRLVGMPAEKIKAQLQFFSNMNMGSGAIKGAAEDLTLLESRWSGFFGFVQRTLGAALLPVLTAAMTRVTNLLKANQGNIQTWATNVGKFMFVALPSAIGRGVEAVANGVQKMAQGIVSGLGFLAKSVKPLLGWIDGLLNGLRQLAITAIASFAAITAARGGPVAAFVAYNGAKILASNQIGVSNLANSPMATSLTNGLTRAQHNAHNALIPAVGAAAAAKAWGKGLQSGEKDRQNEWGKILLDIAKNTGVTADAAAQTVEAVDALGPIITSEVVHGQIRRTQRTLQNMGAHG